MEKKITFDIGIKKIKDLAFSVNEEITPEKESGIQINSGLHFDKTENTIEFSLDIRFTQKQGGVEFMSSKTSTIFFVPDLAKYENPDAPNSFNPPDAMIITIVSLSLTHARALIARNADGTKFKDIYLPIFNPTDITNNLFSKQLKKK